MAAFITDAVVVHGDRPKLETYQRLSDLTSLADLDQAVEAQVQRQICALRFQPQQIEHAFSQLQLRYSPFKPQIVFVTSLSVAKQCCSKVMLHLAHPLCTMSDPYSCCRHASTLLTL